MQIIKIIANANGAHDNQSFHGILPDGWAIIPVEMVIPGTFPFVNIETEEVTYCQDDAEPCKMMTVTKMTDGIMPEPSPETEAKPTQLDILEAQVVYTAMMTDTLLGG